MTPEDGAASPVAVNEIIQVRHDLGDPGLSWCAGLLAIVDEVLPDGVHVYVPINLPATRAAPERRRLYAAHARLTHNQFARTGGMARWRMEADV